MARATGHFHFATGIDDPWMSPAGSAAHAAAIKWSDVLSEAVDLVGYEFSELSNHRPDEANVAFDRMEGLLRDEIDRLIARRLLFFQATIKQPQKTERQKRAENWASIEGDQLRGPPLTDDGPHTRRSGCATVHHALGRVTDHAGSAHDLPARRTAPFSQLVSPPSPGS
jgi:hypothetical protein